jgi:hypothetical protein
MARLSQPASVAGVSFSQLTHSFRVLKDVLDDFPLEEIEQLEQRALRRWPVRYRIAKLRSFIRSSRPF